MPIFEYACKECDHQFEALVYGDEKAECPKCHSKKLAPQLSVFAVSAKVLFAAEPFDGRLRQLWRSPRPGRLFARRYELRDALLGRPAAKICVSGASRLLGVTVIPSMS